MREALVVLALLALAGCASLPQPRQPRPELPAAWPEGQSPHAIEAQWWKVYGDPVLDALVAEALEHNSDLALAAARIEEARANVGLAGAELYPEVQATAAAARNRSTEKGVFPIQHPINNKFQVNLQAAYELDLWGRYREASRAARAELLATRYAQEVVRLGLTAEVVQGYFALRALDARLQLARQTLDDDSAMLDLQRLRHEAGLISELDLRQAEAQLAATRSALAALTGQRRQQELALAVLLGREPRAIVEGELNRGAELTALTPPPAIPAGLPSELLARRPDLRQAEQRLAAAQARIVEARAALYPSLSLTANLGSESRQLSDLFSGPATLWGLGASLAQTVFNAGRSEAALQAADARQMQALAQYEQAVRQAFREVLDALTAHRQARELAEAESLRVSALAGAEELARRRYEAGVDSYLQVLLGRRALYQARQNQIDARLAQLTATAVLVKALGGGWQQGQGGGAGD